MGASKSTASTTALPFCRVCENGSDCFLFRSLLEYVEDPVALSHAEVHTHPVKPCMYGAECRAWLRLCNNGCRMDDRCHVVCYSHPARKRADMGERGTSIAKYVEGDVNYGMGEYDFYGGDVCVVCKRVISSQCWGHLSRNRLCARSNVHVHCCCAPDRSNLSSFIADNGLNEFSPRSYASTLVGGTSCALCNRLQQGLEQEVERNGFGDALVCPDGSPLSRIVSEKLAHPRHLAMRSPLTYEMMLSIILYTGCDCYSDLRQCQREGDFEKWRCFSTSLSSAINLLARSDSVPLPSELFHGLANVKMDENLTRFLANTFMSFSWDRGVSEGFINDNGGNGMLIVLRESTEAQGREQPIAADVSWISKFPLECEVLIGRQSGFGKVTLAGEAHGIQSVIASPFTPMACPPCS